MSKTFPITLAGTVYTARRLTLGQIEDAQDLLLSDQVGPESPRAEVRRTRLHRRAFVAAALAADNPQITVDTLRDMEMPPRVLQDAYEEVAKQSGFKAADDEKKEPPAGEVAPAAPPASEESTSTSSTAD